MTAENEELKTTDGVTAILLDEHGRVKQKVTTQKKKSLLLRFLEWLLQE
jgi:hypothetical protein